MSSASARSSDQLVGTVCRRIQLGAVRALVEVVRVTKRARVPVPGIGPLQGRFTERAAIEWPARTYRVSSFEFIRVHRALLFTRASLCRVSDCPASFLRSSPRFSIPFNLARLVMLSHVAPAGSCAPESAGVTCVSSAVPRIGLHTF